MSTAGSELSDRRHELLTLYDAALPEVYGYLVARCGSAAVAEDLTADTFLAAVDSVRRGAVPELSVAWLIGVARHKLVDHWRRREVEDRALRSVASGAGRATGTAGADVEDDWDVRLDALVAHDVLASLGAHHRSALVLRYLDGLPVRDVADQLGRSLGATEVLLVRARTAFRTRYEALTEREEER